MQSINRTAIVIKPKQPFVDWVNSTPGDDEYTLQELTSDNLIFLMPDYDDYEQIQKYLKKIYHQIFEWELFGWYTDENLWPTNRNWKMFNEWFSYEICSEVFDLVGSPIEIEEV